ncbi:class 3 protein [Rutstroemia sp. NJR-2017a WRK4]|nr:class 3 protein [Rutstroemia sp. NJR-2017a WRK4]
MGIFGRSNKTKSRPQYESENDIRRTNPPRTRPNWYYVEQRPDVSNLSGHNATPQGWLVAPINPSRYQSYPSMPLPVPQRSRPNGIGIMKLQSVTNLLAGDVPSCLPGAAYINNSVAAITNQSTHHLQQSCPLYDLISSKLCSVVTLIDEEQFSGDDKELAVYQQDPSTWHLEHTGASSRDLAPHKLRSKGRSREGQPSEATYTNYFSRVNDYANSKLPMNLPPMRLYMSTYPLLCLAAQYSERVYAKPAGQERETRVNAGWRTGTVMKSVPIDDMDIIVFAIRGTQTFMDWTVNVQTKPKSPAGFLDDTGNLCHAGFLSVARNWIKPVAARLRHLLEENPSRARCSLLITGHSAGGAVAALLYSHMLSTSPEAESELNILTGCFKRIHCVTFGAPPVSLLPLTRPDNPLASKSIFMSFINEGDLVARADFAYVRSLLDLLSTPAPGKSYLGPLAPALKSKKSRSNLNTSLGPVWEVPEATLSNAGSLVLLRGVDNNGNRPNKKLEDRMDDGVIAQMISDDLLRGVVWGDPVCHMMKLYARRIEVLATNAVMGRT